MNKMNINKVPQYKESLVPWSVWLDLPEDTAVCRLDGYFTRISDGKCIDEVYRIVGTDKVVAHYCNERTEKDEIYDVAEVLRLAEITRPSQ